MAEYRIPLLEMVLTMADAVDLVSPAVADHHRRVAYLCHHLGAEAGMAADDAFDLVLAATLHDIGAFSLDERRRTLEFEVEDPDQHAEMGYLFLESFAPFGRISEIIRFHHVLWWHGDGRTRAGIEVPLGSHFLHLADRVEVLVRAVGLYPHGDIGDIVERIDREGERSFHPDCLEAFHRIAEREYVWLDLGSSGLDRILQKTLTDRELSLDDEGLLDFARLLSHLVDFRSRFTSTHTAGVAETSFVLARLLGLDADHCRKIRLAGYLHDLGKLAVPREILDKPLGLDHREHSLMKSHAYFTRRILESVEVFRDVAVWASHHHEKLDGNGYPFHDANPPLESRIIAVADVFTAVSEDRPYRAGMDRDHVSATLRKMALSFFLDPDIVDVAISNRSDLEQARRVSQAAAEREYQATMLRA